MATTQPATRERLYIHPIWWILLVVFLCSCLFFVAVGRPQLQEGLNRAQTAAEDLGIGLGLDDNPPTATQPARETEEPAREREQAEATEVVEAEGEGKQGALSINWAVDDSGDFDRRFIAGRYPDQENPANSLIQGWTEQGSTQEVFGEREGFVFMSSDPGTLRAYDGDGDDPTAEETIGGNGFLLVAYLDADRHLELEGVGFQGNPENGGHHTTWAEEKFLRDGVDGDIEEILRWLMEWYDTEHEEKDNMLLLLPNGEFVKLRWNGVDQ